MSEIFGITCSKCGLGGLEKKRKESQEIDMLLYMYVLTGVLAVEMSDFISQIPLHYFEWFLLIRVSGTPP